MSDSVISVEKLWKRYVINHQRAKSDGIRHILEDAVRSPVRWLSSKRTLYKKQREEFWALSDVSFNVARGEVVGIIGRNGAGKSTLLKILSRITEPTSGRISLNGRVASLLEVGTGFHPELTGRENIFLNGAILGMSRTEIRTKFDEIVDFSEVTKFLDTPVKRYSSGMYVRLAFAVAAHLDPEILIVDEVLAVGDAQFQQKCLGKMQDVAAGGRTVLFVSHNMNAVSRLCNKAVVLDKGRVTFQGDVKQALSYYGASAEVSGHIILRLKDKTQLLRSVSIHQNGELSNGLLKPLAEILMAIKLTVAFELKKPRIGVAFTNTKGERVFAVGSYLGPHNLRPLKGSNILQIAFIMPPIVPGKYTIDLGFYDIEAAIAEEYYSVGTVELAETNYLDMSEPNSAEIGQLHVRSKTTAVSIDE